ncbi:MULTISPECIES: acetylxylan esterase [unclassified Mucilaginibacter]|uniref:acetylxylan esterase n=1 Tax=unclassified Mucilaginibacter TaxID=2617802 RepID=UPI002AC8EAAB|nr:MULTISPECIES: acetylxylan esterase [unclassified Mucilaginibacter]MEB0263386.1 alpha/beta fold hydrolase [Mucilaginibacter sp. 10I4]MEB0278585.1 alpha/beta fold hydrolase [Mucilaginibacter sp. 10B2]MEB0299295.1 alpha/beta fold hydrolase [Mucilaginibacter sp. 5C4]WPX23460.1 alpha/beta fold hydrolase [Mucilaginibacter sp. 5C4]
MKRSNKIFFILCCTIAVWCLQYIPALAQNDEDGISTVLTPGNKNAIFDSKASYTFEVKNPTDALQTGTVAYEITQHGKKISAGKQKANIGKKGSEKYSFDLPALKSGFYKVAFMVNVSDYDDTIRRVFGIQPAAIQSKYAKPTDFDAFWQKAKDELAKVAPQFKVTPMPKMNTDNRKVFAIEMRSLDNYLIKGWMTVPINKNKDRKFSVLLGLPGYQVNLAPIIGLDEDLAIITLNVRGQGNSRGPIDTRRNEFIFYRIEDKDNYVMRGVIMDCIRVVDFVYAQPNLKHDNILVSGGSMGGYLALATASLDKRVNLCSAQNPILCDVNNLDGEVTWPINDIKKYIKTQPGLSFDKVLSNLNYYDGKNFAAGVNTNMIMGIGLLDPYAPPANEYATFNTIPGKKRLMVFKDLGHEISQSYKDFERRWMRDAFALF